MIFRTRSVTQLPDIERIRDDSIKVTLAELNDILLENFRNIYDDAVNLEKTERVTAFPTANLASRGKTVLLEGTAGGADSLWICADTGGAGYGWKQIALT